MGLVKKAVNICGNHYPERNFCTAIINTPMWFNGLYRVVALVRVCDNTSCFVYSTTLFGYFAPPPTMGDEVPHKCPLKSVASCLCQYILTCANAC